MKTTQVKCATEGEPLYSRISFISAIILIVCVPLIFVPDITHSVFTIWKVNVFSFAVFGLVLSWLAKCKVEGVNTLRVPYFALPLVLLAIAHLFATFFSVDFKESMFGTYDRFEGLPVIISYFLIGLLVPTVIGKGKIDRLIDIWFATGIFVSVYGLLQYAGVDFQDWQASFAGARVFSTLGNPLVLAGYIVLTLPMAYARAATRKDILAFVFTVLGTLVLLTTYSRSGWLAFIFVTLLFAVFAFSRLKTERASPAYKPMLLWSLLALIIIVAVFIGSVGEIGPRFVSIFDLESGAVASRLNLWKLTTGMILERPFLGYGPETFLQVSNSFLDLSQQHAEINTRYDRPHSDALQVAFSTGFLGLLAYLAFIYVYFLGVLRFLRKTDELNDYFTVVGMALGVLGYLIAIQFFFSTIVVTPLMWLSVGLTASLAGTKKRVLSRRAFTLTSPLALGLCALLLIPHLMTLASDILSQQATATGRRGDPAYAIERSTLATRLSPWQAEYLLRHGELLDKYGDLDGAITIYKQAIRVSPGRYDGYAYLASIYYELDDAPNAVNYALKALQRYPLQYESRMVYALVSALNGEFDVAEENLLQLEEIDPGDYRAFFYLGLIYRDTGRVEMAKDELGKALVLNPDSPDIGQALIDLGAAGKSR